MPYIPGYAAKLIVNGARFHFTRLRYRCRTDRLRTTNSEGYGAPVATPGLHTHIMGNGWIELSVTDASFDTTNNPFLAPLLLGVGNFCSILILPAGVGGVTLTIPSFGINESGQDINVDGLAPFDFGGEGNGNWTNPIA
jgi:hypothetical protein